MIEQDRRQLLHTASLLETLLDVTAVKSVKDLIAAHAEMLREIAERNKK